MAATVLRNRRKRQRFSKKLSERWRNYFSLDGLIPGIEPTEEQKQVVQSSEKQLIIRGSAGSGKSLMLAYRLIKLMKQAERAQKILYVTFNETLIKDTKKRLNLSETYRELRKKHEVYIRTYHDVVRYLLIGECGYPRFNYISITQEAIKEHESLIARRIDTILTNFKRSAEFNQMEKLFSTHTAKFLQEEFFWMKANGLTTLEKYMEKERTGRGNNPNVRMRQRPTIFYLFEKYNEMMRNHYDVMQLDMEDYALHLLRQLAASDNPHLRYDHILVDEFQDLQPMQIKSLVEMAKDTITLVGDDKQRIYKRSPISYRELNLTVNARTNQRLSKNFRSTKQIMKLASALKFLDVEKVREDDQDFFREGPRPKIRHYTSDNTLTNAMIREIKAIHAKHQEKTIAVVHRYTNHELRQEGNLKMRLEREFDLVGVEKYGHRFDYDKVKKPIFFTDPFEIKGLEFDYVFIIHFDRFHYPSKDGIDALNKRYGGAKWTDPNYEKDFDAFYNDEKKVLYVACSRAKEELHLYYSAPKQQRISQFIRDFHIYDYEANFKKEQYRD